MPKSDLVPLPLAESVPYEISILLVHRYAHTWPAVIELISSGRLPSEHLVTHHFALNEVQAAFETQQHDESAVKVMIHPG